MMYAPVFRALPGAPTVVPRRLMKSFRDGPRKLSADVWRSGGGERNESVLMIRLSEYAGHARSELALFKLDEVHRV